jgi:hypothetical protein
MAENGQNAPQQPEQSDPDDTQAGEESPTDPGPSNNNVSPSVIQQMAHTTLDGNGVAPERPASIAEAPPAQSPTRNGTFGNGVGPRERSFSEPAPVLTLNGREGFRRPVPRPFSHRVLLSLGSASETTPTTIQSSIHSE